MADTARGERLRQLRASQNLSQEDVARALGVTTKAYGAWEGGGGIRPANARKIARYFKVKPGELIVPEIPPAAGPDGMLLSMSDLKRLERKLDDLAHRLEAIEQTLKASAEQQPPPSTPEGLVELLDDLSRQLKAQARDARAG